LLLLWLFPHQNILLFYFLSPGVLGTPQVSSLALAGFSHHHEIPAELSVDYLQLPQCCCNTDHFLVFRVHSSKQKLRLHIFQATGHQSPQLQTKATAPHLPGHWCWVRLLHVPVYSGQGCSTVGVLLSGYQYHWGAALIHWRRSLHTDSVSGSYDLSWA
jgi:hypothetical protein